MIIMNVHEKLPADSKRTCNLGISQGAINNKHRLQLQLAACSLQLHLQLQHCNVARAACATRVQAAQNGSIMNDFLRDLRRTHEDVPHLADLHKAELVANGGGKRNELSGG